MFKKVSHITQNKWYLAHSIRNIQDPTSAQATVCFHNTFLGDTKVSFYDQGKCFTINQSNINPSDWQQLMGIRATDLGREADEEESRFFNKIQQDLIKNKGIMLTHLDKAIVDAAVVDCIISHDEPDEDTVDGCIIS